MQGERSYLNSFPETMNLNQGSDSRAASMEQSATRDNLLNPVEGNNNLRDPLNVNARSHGGWYPGESSSSANSQNQLFGGDLIIEHGWSSSPNTCMVDETSAVDWRYEPHNVPAYDSNSSGYGGPYMHRPLNMNNPSTFNPVNANAIHGYTNPAGENSQTGGNTVFPHIYQPGSSETQHFPTEYSAQNGNGFSSSSSLWGSSSCKRKAFEGCSRQSSSLGYLSTSPQDEDMGRLSVPAHLNPSSSSGLPNSRTTVVIGQEAPEGFPANVAEVRERSQCDYGVEAFGGQHEPVLPDLSVPGTDIRHAVLHGAQHPSRLVPTTEVSELAQSFSGPIPLNRTPSQTNLVQFPGSGRNAIPYSQGEFFGSAGVSSSDLPFLSSHFDNAPRGFSDTRERSIYGSFNEARQILLESPNWSFTPANSSSYRDIASSSHADPSSSSRPFSPVWITHQNPATHTQQRFSEQSPWTRFPPVEPVPRGERGHFSPFIPGPSSPVEAVMPSGSSTEVHQNRSNSRSFWRDVSTDDINGWRALAAGGGGRDRLVSEIRSVLNAMRRAESIGSENYPMFDPYLTGIAEMHDRHRDMRLDVDNMSYEELLALEERIGDVKTGLSEDKVIQLMKQSKYKFVTKESSSNPEPCSVCQENYIMGDDIGQLDCGHEFHTNCIKQWLMLKNICPICKTTGLVP